MRVHVDEAGRGDEAVGSQLTPRVACHAAERSDPAVGDGDVTRAARGAGAVADLRSANDQIEHLISRSPLHPPLRRAHAVATAKTRVSAAGGRSAGGSTSMRDASRARNRARDADYARAQRGEHIATASNGARRNDRHRSAHTPRRVQDAHAVAERPPRARVAGAEHRDAARADPSGEMADAGIVAEIARRARQQRGDAVERLAAHGGVVRRASAGRSRSAGPRSAITWPPARAPGAAAAAAMPSQFLRALPLPA